jgi:hypothetical protein
VGIDYSYLIYVHRRDAARLLTEVAALCHRGDDGHTTVVLPDAPPVEVPGTYGFTPGQTVRLADAVAGRVPRHSFDLAPRFAPDEPLRRYAAANPVTVVSDGAGRVRVALTYLYVIDASNLLPEHWLFDFTPATTGQSRLFLSSPSIRQTFARLASAAGAPLRLLDVEEEYRIVVAERGRPVSTRVPGPCVLWNRRAPAGRAYRELTSAGVEPRWIIGRSTRTTTGSPTASPATPGSTASSADRSPACEFWQSGAGRSVGCSGPHQGETCRYEGETPCAPSSVS